MVGNKRRMAALVTLVLLALLAVLGAVPAAAAGPTTVNLGNLTMNAPSGSKIYSQVWDLTQGDLVLSYTIDMTGVLPKSDWSTSWTNVGLRDSGGDKGWMSSGAPGAFTTNPNGQNLSDKHNLGGAPARYDELSYDVNSAGAIVAPLGTSSTYGLWFDRDGVDPYQANMWGMINGGTYNTGGKYNVVVTFHRVSRTQATMFSTVNGVKTGFYTSWRNGEPQIYPAGKSITGDLGRMQLFASTWAPNSSYGKVTISNLKAEGYTAPSAATVSLAKSGSPSKVLPGGTIDYRMVVQLGAAKKNVTIEDVLVNGVDLVPGSASLDGVAFAPVKTATHLNRNVYEYRLGDLPAGTYVITFQGKVDPNRSCKGQKVSNEGRLYIAGKYWRQNKVDTHLQCASTK